jgi:hypothetical protein
VPVGETQSKFGTTAAEDGIILERQSFPWICEQGHFGLLRLAEASGDDDCLLRAMVAANALEKICVRLGGDVACLAAGRTNKLPGDFVHVDSGVLIEIDEYQHLTSFRLRTFRQRRRAISIARWAPLG